MLHLQPRKPNTDFNLQKMEDIFANAKGKTDEPHRHGYYTVLLVENAKGKHIVDFKTYYFEKHQVHFVGPGQVHQVNLSEQPKGWVITFSRDFLVENNIPENFISNINLFRQYGDNPPFQVDQETYAKLVRVIQEMLVCLPESLIYRQRALGALLQLFLIYCNNSQTMDVVQLDEENNGICLFRNFKKMVDKHYQSWHKVSQYAVELYITPKHLSHIVKSFSGKTAKELILTRLVLEAKRLLLHTNLSAKEIAFQLGFQEPLHFSSFFKKHTQISPTAFREKKR